MKLDSPSGRSVHDPSDERFHGGTKRVGASWYRQPVRADSLMAIESFERAIGSGLHASIAQGEIAGVFVHRGRPAENGIGRDGE